MGQHDSKGYRIGDLSLNTQARTLRRGDVLIELPPLSFGLLALLAERAPDVVSHDEIAERVWPGRVVSPETLTQRVKLLRSALNDDARSPRYVGLVRGEGYRLLCPAHKLTSQDENDSIDPSARPRPRRIAVAAMAVIVLLATAAAFRLDLLAPGNQDEPVEPPALATEKSIAVLPFDDMTTKGDLAYLGDGIADEVLHQLSQSDELRVIARTSSFALRDSGLDIPAIAARLDARYVLQGSLRESNGALRVSTQLIDAHVNAMVWSKTYDFKLDNVFEIQDSVAGEVVGQLSTALTLPKVEPIDPAAYSLYLQAQYLGNRHGNRATQFELLEQALELEPEYADAIVALAWAHRAESLTSTWNGNSQAADQHYQRFRTLLNKVLSKDPGHPSANAALGWEMLRLTDFAAAAAFAERALESEPTHFVALTTAGEIMVRLWREEEGIRILRYVVERDPLTPYHHDNIADAYLNAGAPERAEEAFRTILTLFPDFESWAPWGVGLALLLQGKPDEALRQFETIPDESPLRSHGLALALHDRGQLLDAQTALDRLLDDGGDTPNIEWFIATAYAWFGEMDDAFEFLDRQRQEAQQFFFFMGDSPLYRNFRDDPRWMPFLKSIGLDPESLASVEFDPTLPPGLRL